jgi:hypothetical protein
LSLRIWKKIQTVLCERTNVALRLWSRTLPTGTNTGFAASAHKGAKGGVCKQRNVAEIIMKELRFVPVVGFAFRPNSRVDAGAG